MSTAADIMDLVAPLLNDAAKTSYTYTAQLPYLKMALKELQEEFEQNNVPVTNAESSAIIIPAGTTSISDATSPALPTDLIEIQQLWERLSGSSENYIEMTKLEYLPPIDDTERVNSLVYWAWEGEVVVFLGALTDREIKFDYIKSLFPTTVTSSTNFGLRNIDSFLIFRSAALCAEFIAENQTRAQTLNASAILALDRTLGISTKGRQSTPVRHRPFRSGYKNRA